MLRTAIAAAAIVAFAAPALADSAKESVPAQPSASAEASAPLTAAITPTPQAETGTRYIPTYESYSGRSGCGSYKTAMPTS